MPHVQVMGKIRAMHVEHTHSQVRDWIRVRPQGQVQGNDLVWGLWSQPKIRTRRGHSRWVTVISRPGGVRVSITATNHCCFSNGTSSRWLELRWMQTHHHTCVSIHILTGRQSKFKGSKECDRQEFASGQTLHIPFPSKAHLTPCWSQLASLKGTCSLGRTAGKGTALVEFSLHLLLTVDKPNPAKCSCVCAAHKMTLGWRDVRMGESQAGEEVVTVGLKVGMNITGSDSRSFQGDHA